MKHSYAVMSDSRKAKLEYLRFVRDRLNRDEIDATNGCTMEDVAKAAEVASSLVEKELAFAHRKTLAKFIVALELWATDATREPIAQNDRLSQFLLQFECETGENANS